MSHYLYFVIKEKEDEDPLQTDERVCSILDEENFASQGFFG